MSRIEDRAADGAVRAHGVRPARAVDPDLRVALASLLRTYGLTGVLDALAEGATPALAGQIGPLGNVFIRPMEFPAPGARILGHQHAYDHVTFVTQGVIGYVAHDRAADGTETTREGILSPGAWFFVPKDTWHEFTAIQGPARAACVFSLRDKDGRVVETWNGNLDATQANIRPEFGIGPDPRP